jgi:hypothetical protein
VLQDQVLQAEVLQVELPFVLWSEVVLLCSGPDLLRSRRRELLRTSPFLLCTVCRRSRSCTAGSCRRTSPGPESLVLGLVLSFRFKSNTGFLKA